MSFFGSITLPGLSETSPPIVRHALRRARVIGNFVAMQGVVQMVGFLSGILLVRWLSQGEYAYFTIANAMQSTINLLADIGISVGLVSIGGRVWHDRNRFGQLINTALRVRRLFGAAAILIVTPIMCAMLIKNGAPLTYTALLVVIVVVGLLVQFSLGVLTVVPRLRSDVPRILGIDLAGAFSRLLLIVAIISFAPLAGAAVTIATLVFLFQYLLLRSYAARVLDLDAPPNEHDRSEIFRLTKHLAANTVFYCFQGQITVFLISFFGRHAASVAQVGALGRLAMIFSVLTNLLTNVFVPAFARCQEPRKCRWLYFGIISCVIAFSAAVLLSAAIFPHQFLFVLGNKYTHLERELVLMVAGSVLAAVTGAFWALNSAKAWISGAWLYIPLTLTTQLALIPFVDFSTVSGVLIFNLASAVPNLILNLVLAFRGLRRLNPATS